MSAFARVFCMIRGSRTPQNWEGAVLLSRNRANQLECQDFSLPHVFDSQFQKSKTLPVSRNETQKICKQKV